MIRLIAAIDRQHGIGKNGGQPWFIPDDTAYFSEQTKSHGGVVLVGSTTFKTFKGPLAERHNYVLTRSETPIEDAEIVHDLAKFLSDFKSSDVWIIGGAQLYQQIMDQHQADELYLTVIDADFGCDVFFPNYKDSYKLVTQSEPREQNGFRYYFATYQRGGAVAISLDKTE
jgi:dihydrofolate reductase